MSGTWTIEVCPVCHGRLEDVDGAWVHRYGLDMLDGCLMRIERPSEILVIAKPEQNETIDRLLAAADAVDAVRLRKDLEMRDQDDDPPTTVQRVLWAVERAQHSASGRTNSTNHADGLVAEAAYYALSLLRDEIEREFKEEL